MIQITEEDHQLIELLKHDQVIQEIDTSQMKPDKGAIVVMCCDSDHSGDKFNHFTNLVNQVCKSSNLFLVTRAGAAIWLPESKLLKLKSVPSGQDTSILFDIDAGIKLKNIKKIFLSVHAPCGAANLFKLSLFDQIELLIKGKERLKKRYEKIDGLRIKCFIHVCFPNKKRRTYFISSQHWQKKIENYRIFDYTPNRLFKSAP